MEKKKIEVEKKKVVLQNKIIIKFNPLLGPPIIRNSLCSKEKKKKIINMVGPFS